MKAIKEILTENRDSVISSIKYTFKVWKAEDVKYKMIAFLAYAEANANIEALNESKRVKTDLKFLVQRMAVAQEKEKNMKIYGTERPKLEDIMSKISEHHEENGEKWNPVGRYWA